MGTNRTTEENVWRNPPKEKRNEREAQGFRNKENDQRETAFVPVPCHIPVMKIKCPNPIQADRNGETKQPIQKP